MEAVIIAQVAALDVKTSIYQPISLIGQVVARLEQMVTYVTAILTKLQTFLNFLQAVKTFTFLILLLTCFTNTVNFIKELFSHFTKFWMWVGKDFLPWFGNFTTCGFEKLFALPKCFLWYGLDVASRALYMPVRLLMYVLDLIIGFIIPSNKFFQNTEHSIWCLLDDLDHYIHDKDGLNTGVHIIHFPDSVMAKCYTCKISGLKPPPSGVALISAYLKLIQCAVSRVI
jgi:hypothetical protein